MANSSVKTRKCNICKQEKLLSKFPLRKDINNVARGKETRTKACKACKNKYDGNKRFMTRNELSPEIDFSKPIDLKLLLEIDSWSKEEIRELIHKIMFYKAAPYRMHLNDIYRKHFPSRSAILCGKIYREFLEAAENGEEFEKYFNSDRKYRRDGKKVLAGKK